MSSRILINTPHIKNSGGIANFYQSLAPYFSAQVQYNYITFYPDKSPSVLSQLKLYLVFAIKLMRLSKPIFLANPSFNYKSVRRDWVYLLIAMLLAKKSCVFWHGWDEEYFNELSKKKLGKFLFRKVYGMCTAQFVLASDFKGQLKSLGINSKLYRATTCVDDALLDNLPGDVNITKRKSVKNLLFLSRIEEDKGIFQTLEAFHILHSDFPEIKLKIAGSGSSLIKAKAMAEESGIKDVNFVGYVRGDEKARLLAESDILIFPSYHGEGLPLTLLEAMRFGLVIATTMMGGIKDIYRKMMGPKLEIKSVESIVEGLAPLLRDNILAEQMSEHNLKYVESHFLASNVAESLEAKLRVHDQ